MFFLRVTFIFVFIYCIYLTKLVCLSSQTSSALAIGAMRVALSPC